MFVCMHVREVARMHAFLDAFLVWVHGDQKGTLGGTPQYLFSFNLLIWDKVFLIDLESVS